MTSKGFSAVRRAASYARTVDHLRAWQLRLPGGVREVVISLGSSGETQHAGTKLFLQQNVPQLKFHNPSVAFSVDSQDSDKSQCTLVSADGGHQIVDTTGLQWQDIVQKLDTLFIDADTTTPSHDQ